MPRGYNDSGVGTVSKARLRYLTGEERAKLEENEPIVLNTPAQMRRFLENHENDLRRLLKMQKRTDDNIARMAPDLMTVYLVADSMLKGFGQEGGIASLGYGQAAEPNNAGLTAAIALILSKRQEPAPAASEAVKLSPATVGAYAPLEFPWESATFVAATEQFAGADDVLGATQTAAGAKGTMARTFSRILLNLPTALGSGATCKVGVYMTYDGVNFATLGSYTFTGDGARKTFDTAYYPASPLVMLAAAESQVPMSLTTGTVIARINPFIQVGVTMSGTPTTKGNVKLY